MDREAEDERGRVITAKKLGRPYSKLTLFDREREALLYVRELHEELENMCDGLKELKLLAVSLSSPKMDDMPKSQSIPDTYAQTLVRIEQQERDIAAMTRKIEKAKRSAYQGIGRFIGPFKAFCVDYYVKGLPFVLAQAASGVSERQCKNYMAEIQKKTGL